MKCRSIFITQSEDGNFSDRSHAEYNNCPSFSGEKSIVHQHQPVLYFTEHFHPEFDNLLLLIKLFPLIYVFILPNKYIIHIDLYGIFSLLNWYQINVF